MLLPTKAVQLNLIKECAAAISKLDIKIVAIQLK